MQIGYCILSMVLTVVLTSLFTAVVPEPPEMPQVSGQEQIQQSESPAPTSTTAVNAKSLEEPIDIRPYQKAAALLSFLLFMTSAYQLGWRFGLRDRNVVKMGYAKRSVWKGLIAGALSIAPSAVLLVLVWLIPSMQRWFRLAHYMYEWLFQWTDYHAAAYALVLPAVPLIVHWGFHNGFVDISLRRKLIYRNPRKNNSRFS